MIAQTLSCTVCRQLFEFGEREQKYFAKQGWHPPKRCKACRDAIRARRKGTK